MIYTILYKIYKQTYVHTYIHRERERGRVVRVIHYDTIVSQDSKDTLSCYVLMPLLTPKMLPDTASRSTAKGEREEERAQV